MMPRSISWITLSPSDGLSATFSHYRLTLKNCDGMEIRPWAVVWPIQCLNEAQMGGSARMRSNNATDDRWSGPSAAAPASAPRSYKRPTGANADGAATVRNVLPWRLMEKELAKKLAEKAAKGELASSYSHEPPESVERRRAETIEPPPPPDSGVRASVPSVAQPDGDAMRPLTYSVYTVSELNEVRPVYKSSPPVVAPLPSAWRNVGASGLALFHVLSSWIRLPKPRPALREVAAVPFALLETDVRTALRELPWKKIGWSSLAAFGAVALFLVAVFAVAELTDDMKPTHPAVASKYGPTSAQTPSAMRGAGGVSTNESAAPTVQIELDDEPAPIVHFASAPMAAKSKAKGNKKPRQADIFIP